MILYMLATRFASGALSGESYGPCRVQLLAVALGLILEARLGVPRFAVLELEGAERLPERTGSRQPCSDVYTRRAGSAATTRGTDNDTT